ncbi:hypothetical protein GGR53DRAFT_369067 [Hypoxylon sp. FL1150]|nr:hypothetical protein GGR53DRAFT_369067 [Hypoxylon sp. FL1150]
MSFYGVGYILSYSLSSFPIVPYETDVVTLTPGQRSDVLVDATGEPSDSTWLRTYKPPNCSLGKEESYLATAAIFYEEADRVQMLSTQAGENAYNHYCGNDPLSQTVPVYPLAPDGEPSVTEVVPVELRPNGSSNLCFMANRTFRVDYNAQLLGARDCDFEFPRIQNVHNYGSNGSLCFIIENPGVQPHPVHLHGHNFMVLQEGPCDDNETMFPHGQPDFAHVYSPGEASYHFGGGPNPFADGPPGGRYTGQGPGRGTPDQGLDEEPYEGPGPGSGPGSSHGPLGGRPRPNSVGNYGSCWDGSIVNPQNPHRRDTELLLPGYYIVIQFDLDNPGVWPLHCHIAWHLAGGMGWMILSTR